MLKKFLLIFLLCTFCLTSFLVPFGSSAYVSHDTLFSNNFYTDNSITLSADFDGGFVIFSSFSSQYGPSAISSSSVVDFSSITSGTFQGESVTETFKISENESIKSLINWTYSESSDRYIYSCINFIPVNAGDSFSFKKTFNTSAVNSYVQRSYFSFIPGAKNLYPVHLSRSFSYSDTLSYISDSSNQHIIIVGSSDSYTPGFNVYYSSSRKCSSPLDNVAFVRSSSDVFDIYTTPFNLQPVDIISVKLNSNVPAYSFSVYEISMTEEEQTEEQPTTNSGNGSTEDNSEQLEISNSILANVRNIITSLADIPHKISDSLSSFFSSLQRAVENLKNDFSDVLSYLFVPSDNLFMDVKEAIETKFGFVSQLIELSQRILSVEFLDTPPSTKISIYGTEADFFNWEFYGEVKPYIDPIIIIVSYYIFIRKMIKRLPSIIGGF